MSVMSDFAQNERFRIHRLDNYNLKEILVSLKNNEGCKTMSNKYTVSDGFYGDLETWILDEDVQSKRYRVKNISENGIKKWDLYYFTHIIPLSDGDTLIGLQYGGCKDSEKAVFYHRLSSLEFCYYENDQTYYEEDEDGEI